MTTDQDLDRLLDRWFAQRQLEAHGRVIDVVVGRIERQRQLPAWRVSWRDTPVNTYLKPIAALAAVVIVAVAGIALVARPAAPGSGVLPSATLSSPAPVLSPSTAGRAWWLNITDGPCGEAPVPNGCAGPLTAGTHTSGGFKPAVTLTVPDGWVVMRDWKDYYFLFPDTPTTRTQIGNNEDPSSGILIMPLQLSATCADGTALDSLTAEQLVAALAAHSPAALVRAVTINGLVGSQIDLGSTPDWTNPSLCPETASATPSPTGATVRVLILDSPDGGRFAIQANAALEDFESFMGAAMPIIESARFDVP